MHLVADKHLKIYATPESWIQYTYKYISNCLCVMQENLLNDTFTTFYIRNIS